MARLFDDASSHYLENTTTPVTAAPLSVSAWFNSDAASLLQAIFTICRTVGDNDYFRLNLDSTNHVQFTTSSAAQGAASATTTETYATNTWNHAGGVTSGAGSRFAYLNGVKSTENTTSRTPASLTRLGIGVRDTSTRATFFSGALAEIGLWNVALTDEEFAALARGVRPSRIRAANLVGYWPLWGTHSPEIDLTSGARSATVTGATAANHAPVMPFSRRLWGSVPLIETGGGTSYDETGRVLATLLAQTGESERQASQETGRAVTVLVQTGESDLAAFLETARSLSLLLALTGESDSFASGSGAAYDETGRNLAALLALTGESSSLAAQESELALSLLRALTGETDSLRNGAARADTIKGPTGARLGKSGTSARVVSNNTSARLG